MDFIDSGGLFKRRGVGVRAIALTEEIDGAGGACCDASKNDGQRGTPPELEVGTFLCRKGGFKAVISIA